MHLLSAAPALEFEVLLRREARLGRLDPFELLESYAELAPLRHSEIARPKVLDIPALGEAIRSLPVGFFEAPRILLVPRLERFEHQPLPAQLQAGVLPDGGLALQVSSLGDFAGLAADLCLIAFELTKAWRLLADADPSHDTGHDLPSDAPCDLPSDAPPDAGDGETSWSLAQVAFCLGTDEYALRGLPVDVLEALFALLREDAAIPPILVHGDAPWRRQSVLPKGACKGQVLLSRLAEYGLHSRPIHLWLGPKMVVDMLSPCRRDLQAVVDAWWRDQNSSQNSGQNSGQNREDRDAADAWPVGDAEQDEDADRERAWEAFLAADPRRRDECQRMERRVGIFDDLLATPGDISSGDAACVRGIDLGRLDPHALDAALPNVAQRMGGDILLHWDPTQMVWEPGGLEALLEGIAPVLASITLMCTGRIFEGSREAAPGSICLPHYSEAWAGGHRLLLGAHAWPEYRDAPHRGCLWAGLHPHLAGWPQHGDASMPMAQTLGIWPQVRALAHSQMLHPFDSKPDWVSAVVAGDWGGASNDARDLWQSGQSRKEQYRKQQCQASCKWLGRARLAEILTRNAAASMQQDASSCDLESEEASPPPQKPKAEPKRRLIRFRV